MNEKKLYKVLEPIGLDGRREVGEIIELTEFVASNYPGKLALVEKDVPQEVAPESTLEEMSLPELVKKAEDLGLVSSGSRADILERINLHLNGGDVQKTEEVTPEDSVAPQEEQKTEEVTPEDSAGTVTVASKKRK